MESCSVDISAIAGAVPEPLSCVPKKRRFSSVFGTVHFDQVGIGEDKELEVTFDRASTNKYRNDRSFRIHLLNTTYRFRFAKIVIGTDEAGNETVEYLITNLPKDIVSTENSRPDIYSSIIISSVNCFVYSITC